MKRLALMLLLAIPFCLSVGMQAALTPVVEYGSTGTYTDTRPFTLGYSFSTSITFNVTALGAWDDGLGNNRQVGIWDSAGNLLVSTTVLGTDPVTGHFQYDPVSYALAPGSYVIGAEFLANSVGNQFPANASGITSLPGYTYGTDKQLFGTGLNFPTVDTFGSYGANGILWADFAVGSTPEPSTFLLLGTGLVGAIGAFRRKINL